MSPSPVLLARVFLIVWLLRYVCVNEWTVHRLLFVELPLLGQLVLQPVLQCLHSKQKLGQFLC